MAYRLDDHLQDSEKADIGPGKGHDSTVAASVESSDKETDVDVGYDLFLKAENNVFNSTEEVALHKRVLKKIDMRVLPIMYALWFSRFILIDGLIYS